MKQAKGFASVARERLVSGLRRYEAVKRRGGDLGELHADLRAQISAVHGPAAAEFFDRYRILPYERVASVLWPMSPDEAHRATLLRVAAIIPVFLGVGAALMPVGHAVALAVGVVAAVVTYWAFPLVYRWPRLMPKDLPVRKAREAEYRGMLKARQAQHQKHSRTAAQNEHSIGE